MRALVVIAQENKASRNIRDCLLRIGKMREDGEKYWAGDSFDMAEYAGSIIEIMPKHEADYYIFASTHKSESKLPNFTAHTPGNWGSAEMGGREKMLNVAYGSKVAAAAREMARLSAQSLKWETSIEVDHHGPTLEKPVLFVEIGSSEEQWGNPVAGEIAARGILAAVGAQDAASVQVGFGGSHYCPKFGPAILSGKAVYGHIIPSYSLEKDGIDEARLRQAIGKNVEGVECAAIDWKGVKGAARTELVAILESMGIKWVKA
ncbi:MAG: hypothetical protein NT051_05710 [Candidatus Micrarchaeota archaeon]|nr:hypothetical protein [Candidatus Micrarchaeota archaeon]